MERVIILIPTLAVCFLFFYAGYFLLKKVYHFSKEMSSVIAGAISGVILLVVSMTTLENPPYFLLALFFVFLTIISYLEIKKYKSKYENDATQR